jgi:hypothetical protein
VWPEPFNLDRANARRREGTLRDGVARLAAALERAPPHHHTARVHFG